MKKGFVTMATGDEKYFKMAAYLVQSYRYFTKDEYPFAIITDRINEYTALFDDVVLIKDAEKNYMDKIKLLTRCPYDENIFIDADCLAYDDLNIYWKYFQNADDFSCFGNTLSLDSDKGLFKKEDISIYRERILFVTHLHGVIYFIRNSQTCKDMLNTCVDIINNYNRLYFEGFKEPADESVFALAMALHGCHPVEREGGLYIFLPMAKKISANIEQGKLSYVTEKDGRVNHGLLVHWANVNTKRRLYKIECYKLQKMINEEKINLVEVATKNLYLYLVDVFHDFIKKLYLMQGELKSKIYNILKR